MDPLPTGALVVRVGPNRRPFYEAKWRLGGRQRMRRIGPAWLEAVGGGWQPRRGRVPEDHFDEKRAIVRMAQLIAEDAQRSQREADEERAHRERPVTFREIAQDWMDWHANVRGTRPSTLRDLRSILAEPGTPHARGTGTCRGRILAALGDRPAAEITTREVGAFLRSLDDEGLTARNVNKHRQIVSAIFVYACRPDTFALAANPVAGTDKRREPPPAALDFFEPEEVELLARTAAAGLHRQPVDGSDRTRSPRAAPRTPRMPSSSACSRTRGYASARRSPCAGATSTWSGGG